MWKKDLAAVRENAQLRLTAMRKRWGTWQLKAQKVVRDLTEKGKAREQLKGLIDEFGPAAKFQLNRWKSLMIEAVGIASVGQVRHLEREVSRLSRKLTSASAKSSAE
jgi:hypothetical protein